MAGIGEIMRRLTGCERRVAAAKAWRDAERAEYQNAVGRILAQRVQLDAIRDRPGDDGRST